MSYNWDLKVVGLQQYAPKRKTRIINEQTIKHFQMLLNDETWDTVYKATCVNEMYNSFQTTLKDISKQASL